jgi:GNAT superfamily N-acetyltransferase
MLTGTDHPLMSTEVLTTGWEADAPPGDSLTRRFVLARVERLAATATHAGGRQKWVEGVRMVDLRSPDGRDNAVVVTRPLAESEWPYVVEAATAFYPPERGWVVLSVFPTPDLTPYGLTRRGHPPLMLRPAGPTPPHAPRLEIRAADDAATLADFRRVLVDECGLAEVGVTAVAELAPVRPRLHLRVGYAGGVPVATAGAAVHHGIAEIDWVAVRPGLRGRGYGAAITAAAVDVAPDLPAVLLARDAGLESHRRLGFLDLFRASLWEHQPA